MSKSETMYIAFPFGGKIPAAISGGEETAVPPHEAVRVPRTYGEQLVGDRFAYETEAPKKPAKNRDDGGKKTVDLALFEKAVKDAEIALAEAVDDDAKVAAEAHLVKAQQALAEARG